MELRLPELTETNSEIILTAWHAAEGARVEEGQDVAEVSTDKATFDIPSPCRGVLRKIFTKEGESIFAGETLAEIEEDE